MLGNLISKNYGIDDLKSAYEDILKDKVIQNYCLNTILLKIAQLHKKLQLTKKRKTDNKLKW